MISSSDHVDISPAITRPAETKFPGLPRNRPHRFAKMPWYSLGELNGAILTTLHRQHCPIADLCAPVEYASFELRHLYPGTPQTFPWLERTPGQRIIVSFASSVRECRFRLSAHFYISAIWGNRILRLVDRGIIRLETSPRKQPIGVCWDGTEIDVGTMMEYLVKM